MKYLERFIQNTTKESNYQVPKSASLLFEVIYWLCKVRGHKVVVKFFPHEAADLEPCVELLHF